MRILIKNLKTKHYNKISRKFYKFTKTTSNRNLENDLL